MSYETSQGSFVTGVCSTTLTKGKNWVWAQGIILPQHSTYMKSVNFRPTVALLSAPEKSLYEKSIALKPSQATIHQISSI